MKYYYIRDDIVCGPNSLEEIRDLYRKGEIAATTQVCLDGTEVWQSITDLDPFTDPSANFPESAPLAASPVMATVAPPVIPDKKYDHKVVPFVAVIGQTEGSAHVARQLENMIANYAREGWEYMRLESVETYVAGDNGCFGFGATPPRSTVYSVVVFRRCAE